MVPTIEHVGLDAYCQPVLDGQADIKAMRELKRVMKHGVLIITTPYISEGQFHISLMTPSERRYNRESLPIVKGLHILKEDYFYPKRSGRHLIWIKLNKEEMNKLSDIMKIDKFGIGKPVKILHLLIELMHLVTVRLPLKLLSGMEKRKGFLDVLDFKADIKLTIN